MSGCAPGEGNPKEGEVNKRYIGILALLLFLDCTTLSHASEPVYKTVTGCVAGGVLYSLEEVNDASAQNALVAYPLKITGLNLNRFEGKKVSVQGYLLPGDRFNPAPGSLEVLGPCTGDRVLQYPLADRIGDSARS